MDYIRSMSKLYYTILVSIYTILYQFYCHLNVLKCIQIEILFVVLSCFDVFSHIFLFLYILFINYIYIFIILYIYYSITIPSIYLLCIHYTSHSLILVGYTRMVALHLCMHHFMVILKLSNYYSIEVLMYMPRMM
jgi:hypothetical protein